MGVAAARRATERGEGRGLLPRGQLGAQEMGWHPAGNRAMGPGGRGRGAGRERCFGRE